MSWLPLILPRPELFHGESLPDLGHRDRAELISFTTQKQDAQTRLWSLQDTQISVRGLYIARDHHERQIRRRVISHMTQGLAVSLPIFTWIHLFSHATPTTPCMNPEMSMLQIWLSLLADRS